MPRNNADVLIAFAQAKQWDSSVPLAFEMKVRALKKRVEYRTVYDDASVQQSTHSKQDLTRTTENVGNTDFHAHWI